MKCSILSVFLCLMLVLSLVGCGNEPVSAPGSSSAAQTAPEAFGDMSLADTPIQEAETTALPASAPDAETSQREPQSSLEEPVTAQDFTEQAVMAAIICDAMDMLEYTPEDSMYLWRSVGYLIGQIGTDADLITMADGFGQVSEEDVSIFAYAMNANFDGNMPSVTEEDPLISTAEDGSYLVNMLDQGNLELNMTQNRFSADTDTFTEKAELMRDGESLGVYTVTLTNYTSPNSAGQHYFAYSIVDITPAA